MDLILQTILPFVGILVVLIVIHELGHYLTAKLTGVKVLEAGIGYPPRLWGFTWRDTIYSINWLPLGGFVRLLGEEDPTDPQSLAAKPRWIRLIVLASGAGMNFLLPVLLFAIVFMIPRDVNAGLTQIVSVVESAPASEAKPVTVPDALDPDEAVGLRPGDVVYAVNGNETRNPAEVGRQIRLNLGKTITVTVRRVLSTGEVVFIDYRMESRWAPPDIVHTVEDGDTVSSVASLLGVPQESVRDAAGIEIRLKEGQQLSIPDGNDTIAYVVRPSDSVSSVARSLGVTEEAVRQAAGLPDPDALTPGEELRFAQGPTGITIATWNPAFIESESFPPWVAVRKGADEYLETLVLFRNQVFAWFNGGSSPEFAGPVGIAQVTGEIVEQSGWKALLELAALLSFNLGVFNILPLPFLDGGRIAFVVLEIIRRGRRVAPEKEAMVHLIGLALVLTAVVYFTYNDIVRIIGGESLFR